MQEVSQNWQKSHFIAHNVGALSPGVKDMLDKILVVDPKERITIQGITEHPWYPPYPYMFCLTSTPALVHLPYFHCNMDNCDSEAL